MTINRIDDEVPILVVAEPLVVTPGRQRCLDSSNLQVTDSDTNLVDLQYIVRSTAKFGEFSIKLSEQTEKTLIYGDVFKQDDVDKVRVCYVASIDVAEDVEYLTFDVTDGTNILRNQEFNVLIKSSFEIGLNITVILDNNEGDGIYKISSKHFETTDITLDRRTLWFRLSKDPQHGDVKILRNKIFKPVQEFSAINLKDNIVIYYHDITFEETMDAFQIELYQKDPYRESIVDTPDADELLKVLRTFNIAVIDPEKNPILVSIRPMSVFENNSKIVSNEDISIKQGGQLIPEIELYVTQNPSYGELRSRSSNKQVFKFSAGDLTKGDIYYMHSGRDVSRRKFDGIGLTLSDPRRPSQDCWYYMLPDSTYPTKDKLQIPIELIPIDNRAPKIYVNTISSDLIARADDTNKPTSRTGFGHFSVIPISRINLRAYDEDSKSSDVFFVIQNSTRGFICSKKFPSVNLYNFTQEQLDDDIIGFCLPHGSFATDGYFTFRLQDSSEFFPHEIDFSVFFSRISEIEKK